MGGLYDQRPYSSNMKDENVGAAMTPLIDDKTSAMLRGLNLSSVVRVVGQLDGENGKVGLLQLPPAVGADYFFQLSFYQNGERQICAKLLGSGGAAEYFWYRPFELEAFGRNRQHLVDAFCEELKLLLTHATRIVQRKGWLFWRLRCDYWDGKHWKPVSGNSAFRGGKFHLPPIPGTTQIYQSRALVGLSR